MFEDVGCVLCHTPTLHTGNVAVAALRDKPVNLFSDLALHNMGPGLADDISRARLRAMNFARRPCGASGRESFSFTTAERRICSKRFKPIWGPAADSILRRKRIR